MQKTFLFDLDDTLIKNHHKYSYTQMEFVKWLIERLGPKSPDLQAIIDLQTKIDSELVESNGFSKDRFPTSFAESYKRISSDLGINDPEGAKIAYGIGMRVFDEKKWKSLGVGGLIYGADEALDYLTEQNDELMLVTKGDLEVQRAKIEIYGLEKRFGRMDEGRIHIVERKDGNVLERIVGNRDKTKVWHVGNLIKSDVLPGLDAGLNVIYVPCETWSYEKKHDGLPDDPRVRVIKEIRCLINIYDSL